MMKTSIAACVVGVMAGCVGVDDGDGPPKFAEVAQGLGSYTIRWRDINLTADVLADWTSNNQISAALVTGHTLKVRFCAEHFPQNSVQRANLIAAVNAYSGVPGVAINLVDVAEQPNTQTHPNLATFTLPADAIYIDYSPNLANDVDASTDFASCDTASPQQCTRARIYVNANHHATDPPSKGVFMHELGHVFGMVHINEDDDSVVLRDPQDMWFDRTTIHGHKYESDDFRGLVIHAGTLAFLRHYYAATTDGTLGTDEIVAHRAFSFVGDTIILAAGPVAPHYEWDPAKTYGWGTGGSLVAPDLNEVKLRWNSTADVGTGVPGGFEPCSQAAGTLPHWFARMSETSTNTVDKLFEAVFEVTNSDAGTTWSQVATQIFDSYVAGAADFRQIDWDASFPLSAAAFGLQPANPTTMLHRKLRFRADANDSLIERNEANNDWEVNVCLYPSNSWCLAPCEQ
jgi:hypothetical protein